MPDLPKCGSVGNDYFTFSCCEIVGRRIVAVPKWIGMSATDCPRSMISLAGMVDRPRHGVSSRENADLSWRVDRSDEDRRESSGAAATIHGWISGSSRRTADSAHGDTMCIRSASPGAATVSWLGRMPNVLGPRRGSCNRSHQSLKRDQGAPRIRAPLLGRPRAIWAIALIRRSPEALWMIDTRPKHYSRRILAGIGDGI